MSRYLDPDEIAELTELSVTEIKALMGDGDDLAADRAS